MKATLTADWTLTITPETPVEAYALTCWSRAGKRGKHGPLEVNTVVPSSRFGTLTIGGNPYWGGTSAVVPVSLTGNGSLQYVGSTYTTGDAAPASAEPRP